MPIDAEPRAAEPREELLAADRRTLVIGAVAMVVLLLVGVTSAALFTRSACRDIAPRVMDDRLAGTDPGAAIAAGLPALDGRMRTALVTALADLVADLGAVVGAAAVSGGSEVAPTADGFAVTGPVTTLVTSSGARVRATADLDGARVVGDGEHLFALRLVNDATGQVDALQPLDGDLGGMTCQDTATVGTPLAFHLDASGGELLLFRVDEDGGDADLELRDPIAGSRWRARFDAGSAPPGTLAARLSGGLGDELVVAARRSAVGDVVPVVLAVDRATGAHVWARTREEVLDGSFADADVRVEVAAVTADRVLVSLRPEDGVDGEVVTGGPVLVVLDAADGSVLARDESPREGDVVDVLTESGQRRVLVALDGDPGRGAGFALGGWPGDPAVPPVTGTGVPTGAAGVMDGRFLVLTEGSIVTVDGDRAREVALPVEARSVAVSGGHVALLLADSGRSGEAGDGGAVLITFAR